MNTNGIIYQKLSLWKCNYQIMFNKHMLQIFYQVLTIK